MARLNSQSRSATRQRLRKRRKQKRMLPTILLIGAGVIILGLSWYFITNPDTAQTNFEYSAEDIAYEQPIHAIHEMEGAKLDEIPFLPKDGPQPKISVLEDFYSFGSIGPTDVVEYDFVLTNQGDAPLTISRAYTTCGCTTADFTATIIPPGKVSIITLVLDAGFHDVSGQTVRRGLIIENNDPKNPQVELWTQASVRNSP